MRPLHFLAGLIALCLVSAARAEPQWMTFPPTPSLPTPVQSGYAPVDGVRIWFATFGKGDPVILLHGGLANSNYWGAQVDALSKDYRVIVMDSRGHGRSTRDAKPYGYDLMASDVIGLMDFLKIPKATIVGWSDGAIIGLDIAIHNPDRLSGLFSLAANSDPSAVKDVSKSPVFNAFLARARTEYKALSPTPTEFDSFVKQVTGMWADQPHFTAEQLRAISTPTWIVDADHDEAIKRENTLFLADQIPNAGLSIEPDVSHFAILQDPQQVNADLLRFLAQLKQR